MKKTAEHCVPFGEGVHLEFEDWTRRRELPTVGTNAGADALPFQSWRRFKEAFAPELVEQALFENPGTTSHIVDPFGGSGTTALAAQFLGVRPTTIEVNPFLADLIEAKIGGIDVDCASACLRAVVEGVAAGEETRNPTFPGAPDTFVEPGREGRYVFSKAMAARVLAYRAAIDRVADHATKRLFRVVLGSALIPCSNVTVSGKGRRYRGGWERRKLSPVALDTLFREGVAQALYDLRRYDARRCRDYALLRGDARTLAAEIGPHDLAVFSPPYPNSFDYTDVYNVELWGLGYLDGREANAQLRSATLRSHVQIHRDMSRGAVDTPALSKTLAELNDVRSQLWNPHIPEMVGAYAADMACVLGGLAQGMRVKGRAYIVVGDSRYAGVNIPVAEILGEMAPAAGYRVERIEPCRSMRASPQQGGRAELAETLVVLSRI